MIDANLVLSDAQAITATAASTSYVDQGAAGDVVQPGAWLIIGINLAFTSNSATVAFALETDSDSAFGTAVVLFSSGAIADTSLTPAGTIIAKVKLPVGLKRYIRMKYTATGTPATGKVDARIVNDVDVLLV